MGVVGRPVEFAADSYRAGDEGRRIAGAARGFDERDFAAGDTACGGDDLANAEACAVAEIVDAVVRVFEGAKDLEVRLGEIVDVDVVANTGAVGGGIVGAKNMDGT